VELTPPGQPIHVREWGKVSQSTHYDAGRFSTIFFDEAGPFPAPAPGALRCVLTVQGKDRVTSFLAFPMRVRRENKVQSLCVHAGRVCTTFFECARPVPGPARGAPVLVWENPRF
jgi:hypothetical protein